MGDDSRFRARRHRRGTAGHCGFFPVIERIRRKWFLRVVFALPRMFA